MSKLVNGLMSYKYSQSSFYFSFSHQLIHSYTHLLKIFELVAEGKWGYKWIKWIIKVELSDNENYRGFWESRGYSNTADINKEPREE